MEIIMFVNRYGGEKSPTGRLLAELSYDLGTHGMDTHWIVDVDAQYPREMTVVKRLIDDVRFYRKAWKRLCLYKPTIAVMMTDPPLLPIVAALSGNPFVVWMQDVYPDLAVKAGYLPEWLAKPIRKAMIWALKKAEKVVVIGSCMQRHLKGWGVESEVIPNWVDGNKWPFTEVHDGTRAYLGRAGVVHGYAGETVSGLSEDVFLKECQRTLTHIVTLREDMLGLSVPSKVYTALACGRYVEWHGPKDSEAYLIATEAGATNGLRSCEEIRRFFEHYCDRKVQTEKWGKLIMSLK